ncbi:MAG: hypothetical protein EA344_02765 [Alkalicoccus sp.]|nr:MAG: hypothetical protein EA344_02765 [Alkalicoccus sp.]
MNTVLSSVKPKPGQRRLRKKKAGRSSRSEGQPVAFSGAGVKSPRRLSKTKRSFNREIHAGLLHHEG